MKSIFNRVIAENNILIRKLLPRPSVIFAKQHFNNKKITACEVGTYKGHNAKSIIDNLNIKHLYCVDPYWCYDHDQLPLNSEEFNIIKGRTHKMLSKYKNKFKPIYYNAKDAVKSFFVNGDRFDFVYLDGNHKYDYVKQELESFWELLNPNGIIAGHDIDHEGVFKAVGEFALKNNLKIHLRFPDWWIVK